MARSVYNHIYSEILTIFLLLAIGVYINLIMCKCKRVACAYTGIYLHVHIYLCTHVNVWMLGLQARIIFLNSNNKKKMFVLIL